MPLVHDGTDGTHETSTQARSWRADLVRTFAFDPIACSTLQPGLSYVDASYGYLAYRHAAGFDVALGPPVCAPHDKLALMERFCARSRRPLFVYLRDDDAKLAQYAAGRGFSRCGMGVDKLVSLSSFTLDACAARVRGAVRKAARAGVVVDEVARVDAPLRARLREITRSYLSRSAVPVEMRFLNRPLDVDDGAGRLFLVRPPSVARASRPRDQDVIGYAVIDPYRDGALLNLLRLDETKLWGLYYVVAAALAEGLRSEGHRELSLGWSPLVDVDTACAPPVLARQVRWMERRFLDVDYLARLKELKAAFPGHTVQRYTVAPTTLGPALGANIVLALVIASGVPLDWMLGPQLFRAFTPSWLAALLQQPAAQSPSSAQ